MRNQDDGTGRSAKPTGSENADTPLEAGQITFWPRIVYVIVIALLIELARSALHLLTLAQLVLALIDTGKPNATIAAFGETLGNWLNRAARYQTAQSPQAPWPFDQRG